MKKLSALLVALVLLLTSAQAVFAAPPVAADTLAGDIGIQPARWEGLAVLQHGVTISGSTANVSVNAKAYSSSYRIELTLTLQKASGSTYSDVQSWSGSGSGSCAISKSTSVSSGIYRTKAVVRVYSGNTLVDSFTDYSTTVTC